MKKRLQDGATTMIRTQLRSFTVSIVVLIASLGVFAPGAAASVQNDEVATPTASLCAAIPPGVATPASGMGMPEGTPDSTTAIPQIEFDLLFIDMMIPHHESAVVMAQIALERAEHPEIRELAAAIISAQSAEIAQLQAWRDEWYPNAEELPIDQMNMMMTGMTHGMLDMDIADMSGPMAGMDASSAFIALCQAAAPFDLAFIDAMIPHHQSAITMANIGLENSIHEELKTLELAIIDAQQNEIDEMIAWRSAWYGPATPAS